MKGRLRARAFFKEDTGGPDHEADTQDQEQVVLELPQEPVSSRLPQERHSAQLPHVRSWGGGPGT